MKSRRIRTGSRPRAHGRDDATDEIQDAPQRRNHAPAKAGLSRLSAGSRPQGSRVASTPTQSIGIALTLEEAERLRHASRAHGMSVQRFLRELVTAAASEILGDGR